MTGPYAGRRTFTSRDGARRIRPTRLAAGMSLTADRSAHRLDGAALSLAVRGTTDALHGLAYRTTRGPLRTCGCCYQPVRRLVLNDAGRRRLAGLRARRISPLT